MPVFKGKLLPFLCSLFLCASAINAETHDVKLGITNNDGTARNTEFVAYDKLHEFYKQNGIYAALIPLEDFTNRDIKPDRLYSELKKYNAIMLSPDGEASYHLTPELIRRAENVGEALSKYVSEGGGLLIQPRPVRYANDDEEKYWNIVYKAFDLELLHEGILDKKNLFKNKIKPNLDAEFFSTSNIKQHPVSADISTLNLPLRSYYPNAGTPAVKYGPEWQIVIGGESTAKSYISDPVQNILSTEKEGFYKSEPPVVAVRQFGKGRIVSIAVDKLFTGMNYLNPFWSNIVENSGSMKLMAQSVKWISEPNASVKDFGTYNPIEHKGVRFPESCSWDDDEPAKGIIGAHTSYTDGSGTVEDFVKAAKKAGLSFIVFADPLEQLSAEKLAKLKKDCAKFTNSKFFACPGIEFTDGSGIRWLFCGEKIMWPGGVVFHNDYGGTYPLWDGKAVNHYGKYSELSNYCTSAVINYNELRAKGASPENMWWFYNVIPYAYDGNKLIADNFKDWLFALRDLRRVSPLSFTRIKNPDEVALAATVSFTGLKSVDDAKRSLNSRCTPYWAAQNAIQFTSYGDNVEILDWKTVNDQMEQNIRYTKGAQRIKLKFTVKSPAGIKDVKVYDSDYGIIRRFISSSNDSVFTKNFELVHDKQHILTLVAEDINGKKAISSMVMLYSYKQGLFRCGDNLNILGPLGMYWHPDRSEMFPLVKDFRNAEFLSVQGWDRGGPDCPVPGGRLADHINIKGIGEYPNPGDKETMLGKRMNVQLASNNLQIAEMKMDSIIERFDNQKRPGPSFASIARKISDNEYFERTDRMIAPMDRMDHYVAWNHRRLHESLSNYMGSYLWHEGEIKFKKDVVLTGSVPIPLAWSSEPLDLNKKWGNILIVKDAEKGDLKLELRNEKDRIATKGRIAAGGYATHMNFPVGYIGIVVPEGMDFAYSSSLPGRLSVGIGKEGQEIKAGTVLKYAFLAGDFTDQNDSSARLEYVSKAFNMAGGKDGYPVDVKVGEFQSAVFFFSIRADKNEALFTLGPKKDIGIDLPIKVTGIEDNGCAAVYTTDRKWFRFVSVMDSTAYLQEPIDEKNEIWAGNIFVADNKNVAMTLVMDGQGEGKRPFLEIHNPTDTEIVTKISSPAHTPVFGGLSFEVKLLPGESIFRDLTH